MRANSDIISGTIFGNFKVLHLTEEKHGKVQYLCSCVVCAFERAISGYDLKNGRIPRCVECAKLITEEKTRITKAKYYQKYRERIGAKQKVDRIERPISTANQGIIIIKVCMV